MAVESKHIAQWIKRPAAEVYNYAADPANLPRWASGLSNSVEIIGGQLFAESPMGRIKITFAPPNEFGVLDHDVTLPSGETVHNPMRVIAAGDESEAVFTLRRMPAMTDDEFERDAATVAGDPSRLRRLLEQG